MVSGKQMYGGGSSHVIHFKYLFHKSSSHKGTGGGCQYLKHNTVQ